MTREIYLVEVYGYEESSVVAASFNRSLMVAEMDRCIAWIEKHKYDDYRSDTEDMPYECMEHGLYSNAQVIALPIME